MEAEEIAVILEFIVRSIRVGYRLSSPFRITPNDLSNSVMFLSDVSEPINFSVPTHFYFLPRLCLDFCCTSFLGASGVCSTIS